MRAGVDFRMPSQTAPALSGPTAADIAAAQDMTAEDRMAMIQGMVDGLSARLADEGGTAQEWGRLISALGVLGETGRAQTIYREARDAFANTPDLRLITDAAREAGIIQ